MKKVSVQFNLVVADSLNEKDIIRAIKLCLDAGLGYAFGNATSIQINNTEKRGKR